MLQRIWKSVLCVGLVLVSGCTAAKEKEPEKVKTVAFPKDYALDADIQKNMLRYARLNPAFQDIVTHADAYSDMLFRMLNFNPETFPFVLDFPKRKGSVDTQAVIDVKKGEIPLLIQWDKRWGYASYGDNFIGAGGCGPTALAMVIAGLTGQRDVTPYTVAQYAENKGYYVKGIGTSWDLISEGGTHFGVQAHVMGNDRGSIYARLKQGYPIICSMSKGVFTSQGHFIVLRGIQDGLIQVNDPNNILHSNGAMGL